MPTVNYPLPNGDLYVSEIPQEIIEHFIITQNNIDSHKLNICERERKFDEPGILFNQYHLVQYCDSIDTILPMDIIRCDYHYESIEGQRVVGNFYVPHFHVKPFKSQKDLSFNHNCIKEICHLIDQLPTEKENIHIGFVQNDTKNAEELYSNLVPFKKVFIQHGYFPNSERVNGPDFVIDDFGAFSWDDNIFKTITVIIDLSSDEKQVVHNVRRFLTMEDDYSKNDFYCGTRLIYISYYYANNHFKDINPKLLSSLPEWMEISKYPYYLFPMWFYYPVSSNVLVDERDWEIRRLIWNFKGDTSKVTVDEHLSALSEVKEKVITTIGCTFVFDLKQEVVFCCVPSSTKSSYASRFEDFSKQVCERLNMINGYDMINYLEDSTPKHLGGEGTPQYNITNNAKGKTVIVFDDIYTTGTTMIRFCTKLYKRGAYVIAGIVLGMTETDKCHEDHLGYKGYFDMNSINLW